VGGRSDLGHVDRADHRENTNSESKNDSAGNPERTEKKASVGASANKLRSIRLSTKGLQKSMEGSLNLHHLEVLSTTLDGTSYEADDTTDEDGALSGDLVGEVPREESADESATGKDRDDSYRRRKKKKRHRQRPQSGSGRVRRAGKKGRTSGLARIDGVLSVGLEGTHVLLELLIGYDRRTFFFHHTAWKIGRKDRVRVNSVAWIRRSCANVLHGPSFRSFPQARMSTYIIPESYPNRKKPIAESDAIRGGKGRRDGRRGKWSVVERLSVGGRGRYKKGGGGKGRTDAADEGDELESHRGKGRWRGRSKVLKARCGRAIVTSRSAAVL
jgi:hypothetical protein